MGRYIGVPDTDAAPKHDPRRDGEAGPSRAGRHPNVGRFAMVADPGGAIFYCSRPLRATTSLRPPMRPRPDWSAGTSFIPATAGGGVRFLFGPVRMGDDARDVYGPEGTYRIFGADGVQWGDNGQAREHSSLDWGFYINVDGIDAAIERILANGARFDEPARVPGGAGSSRRSTPRARLRHPFTPARRSSPLPSGRGLERGSCKRLTLPKRREAFPRSPLPLVPIMMRGGANFYITFVHDSRIDNVRARPPTPVHEGGGVRWWSPSSCRPAL